VDPRRDRWAAPFATDVLDAEVEVQPGLRAIPTPGHTKGSTVFLLEDRYLFTGDSLAWSHDSGDLTAFRGACWYSWPVQTESLAALGEHRFEWVLPGHGARVHLDADDARCRLVSLVERMRRTR
jgi:glyoxylase-like metal-dependent hydrolase (beta-lactamase superfamily II)